MKAIDLFCGAGGASLGMLSAGIEVILGIDHCPETAWAYSEVTGVDALVTDVGALQPSDLPDFDLAWASPPCQPYSTAGKRRGRTDERDAVPALVQFIARFRPPMVVIEEVPAFWASGGHDLFSALIRGKYYVESRVLNAASYGVPQARRRLFITARLDRHPWRWARATHAHQPGLFATQRWVSLDDAVGDQVRCREHLTGLPDWIVRRWWQVPAHLRDNVQISSQLTTRARNGRRDWLHIWPISRPAFTVTASMAQSCSHIICGGRAWRLTLEDTAKLQCLPYRQSLTASHIGNAVPPPMARAVVQNIKEGGSTDDDSL